MLDPLAGRVKLDEAEQVLGIDDDMRDVLKQVSLLRIIRARLGITDAEVQTQYENDIKEQIQQTRDVMSSLIHGGFSNE